MALSSVREQVLNCVVVDQMQTDATIAADAADRHGVTGVRASDGNRRISGRRSRLHDNEITGIDPRHRLAERYGEVHGASVSRAVTYTSDGRHRGCDGVLRNGRHNNCRGHPRAIVGLQQEEVIGVLRQIRREVETRSVLRDEDGVNDRVASINGTVGVEVAIDEHLRTACGSSVDGALDGIGRLIDAQNGHRVKERGSSRWGDPVFQGLQRQASRLPRFRGIRARRCRSLRLPKRPLHGWIS